MNLREFQAWFEGYTEEMDERPSAKQWAKIKAKIKEIDGKVTVYHEYWPRYRPYYDWYENTSYLKYGNDVRGVTSAKVLLTANGTCETKFDPVNAMYTAGKLEWKSEQ